MSPNQLLTATATDPAGNTPAFSNCIAISTPAAPDGSGAALSALGTATEGSPASAAGNPPTTSAGPRTGDGPSTWERRPVDGFRRADPEVARAARPVSGGGTAPAVLPAVAPDALDVVLAGLAGQSAQDSPGGV